MSEWVEDEWENGVCEICGWPVTVFRMMTGMDTPNWTLSIEIHDSHADWCPERFN